MFFPAWGCWETCLPGGSQLRGEQFLSFMWEMKRNSCLCCNCREMVLPSGSRGFGLNSQLSFIHFSEPWFFFFFDVNSNFDIALTEAKLSLHMHKAYVKICYVSIWGLPSLWEAGLAAKPLSISSLMGQPSLPCAGHMAEPGVSQLGAVKGCWYMELIPCSPSYCPTIPEWPGTNPMFSFQGAHLKNRIWQKQVAKE